MINNFNLIRGLLQFTTAEDFYFVQILKRRKDNPSLSKDMIVINYHCIYSHKEFDNYMPIIIDECTINNARAYININRRNSHRVAVRTMVKISEMIQNRNYRNIKGAYVSACGKLSSEEVKKWVIDIDSNDVDYIKGVTTYLETIVDEVVLIKTKNGYHAIVRGFDSREFKRAYPEIEIQRDNPTILYIP